MRKKRTDMSVDELIDIRNKDKNYYVRKGEWRSKKENKKLKSAYNLEYRNRPGIKDKLAIQNKKWRESQRGKEYRIAYEMDMYYGITTQSFYDKWLEQNGKCKICGADMPGRRDVFIDHDHSIDSHAGVRDLLCKHCNSILGLAKESPEILRAAARYIEKWRCIFHSKGAS